ncbi:MAG TPA: hypothetical protein VNM37_04650 [Candidatus Dormibacteraeota bacterium]|nr:hypothetical protein [Candidatus Dormibacteraeota bacterium]
MNAAPWISKDGVTDANLLRAARDMFDALEEVYASASSGGISSVAWLKLCDARRKAHGAV